MAYRRPVTAVGLFLLVFISHSTASELLVAEASAPRIVQIEPPEKGFFSKCLDFHGIPIKAHAVVADEALFAAYGRLNLLLSNLLLRQPLVLSNLLGARVELHIIGRDQVTTDLPEW